MDARTELDKVADEITTLLWACWQEGTAPSRAFLLMRLRQKGIDYLTLDTELGLLLNGLVDKGMLKRDTGCPDSPKGMQVYIPGPKLTKYIRRLER